MVLGTSVFSSSQNSVSRNFPQLPWIPIPPEHKSLAPGVQPHTPPSFSNPDLHEGERVLALESREGTRASRRIEVCTVPC